LRQDSLAVLGAGCGTTFLVLGTVVGSNAATAKWTAGSLRKSEAGRSVEIDMEIKDPQLIGRITKLSRLT
jgi:hypothetical protein